MCLKRDFDFDFHNLFDTMIAARICGYKQIGLGSLLNDLVGLAVDKSHQRDDWGQRPLPTESLLYAQMDTHFLPALRDHFVAELDRLDRVEEANKSFLDVLRTPPARREPFDPESFWRLCAPNHLTRRQAAVVRELYLLRERLAESRDVPPFKIMTDKVLVAITRAVPTNSADLRDISGLSAGQVRRYGRELLDAINEGCVPSCRHRPRPNPPLIRSSSSVTRRCANGEAARAGSRRRVGRDHLQERALDARRTRAGQPQRDGRRAGVGSVAARRLRR